MATRSSWGIPAPITMHCVQATHLPLPLVPCSAQHTSKRLVHGKPHSHAFVPCASAGKGLTGSCASSPDSDDDAAAARATTSDMATAAAKPQRKTRQNSKSAAGQQAVKGNVRTGLSGNGAPVSQRAASRGTAARASNDDSRVSASVLTPPQSSHVSYISSTAVAPRPGMPSAAELPGSLPFEGGPWDTQKKWVVFSDLHLNTKTLQTCMEVLKKVRLCA
eukprot:363169-Chlamydomonas_euryale.AAC.53